MTSKGMKLIFAAATFAALGASSTQAFADDDNPWGTLSASVAIQSDYRFRGISQNDNDPSPQGSINWSGPEGFYAGAWAAKINFQGATDYGVSYSDHTSLETDFFAGKHTDLWGTDLNVEAYLYAYPDHDIRTSGYHDTYFEAIAQLSHPFGPVTLTATTAYSPNFFAQTGTGWYIEGTAAYAVNDWLSLSANLGHQWISRVDDGLVPDRVDIDGGEAPYSLISNGLPYTHWDIGATFTYKAFALDLRYIDTNLSSAQCFWTQGAKNLCNATVVATLTYNISSFPW